MGWDGKERRRKKRYAIRDSTVRYRKGGLFAFLNPPSAKYLLLNFNSIGCHFITKEDIPAGMKLLLSLEAPRMSGTVRVRGSVVWSRRSEEMDAYRIGVQFSSISGTSHRVLQNLLDSAILENVEITTKVYMKEIEKL